MLRMCGTVRDKKCIIIHLMLVFGNGTSNHTATVSSLKEGVWALILYHTTLTVSQSPHPNKLNITLTILIGCCSQGCFVNYLSQHLIDCMHIIRYELFLLCMAIEGKRSDLLLIVPQSMESDWCSAPMTSGKGQSFDHCRFALKGPWSVNWIPYTSYCLIAFSHTFSFWFFSDLWRASRPLCSLCPRCTLTNERKQNFAFVCIFL